MGDALWITVLETVDIDIKLVLREVCDKWDDHALYLLKSGQFPDLDDLVNAAILDDDSSLHQDDCIDYLKWIFQEHWCSMGNQVFTQRRFCRWAIRAKKLDVLKWLVNIFHLTHKSFKMGMYDSMDTYMYMIEEAFSAGDDAIFHWLFFDFQLSVYYVSAGSPKKYNFTIQDYNSVISGGSVTLMKWLYENSANPESFTQSTGISVNYLHTAISRGHCEMVQYLLDTGKINITPKMLSSLFRRQSGAGMRWLCDNYPITRATVRDYQNDAVLHLIRLGDLDTVKWLIQKFALTPQDVCDQNCLAFSIAALHGHHHILLWLSEQYVQNK